MGTGKFRQLVPSPESRSFVLTFSHPDLPRSKSAGTGHATAAPTCRLGTGLTVGSGLAPDPPRPFARPAGCGLSVPSKRHYRRSGIDPDGSHPAPKVTVQRPPEMLAL